MDSHLARFASGAILRLLQQHECIRCGQCCQWEGGVFLYPSDILRISRYLDLTREQFIQACCGIVAWTYDGKRQYRLILRRPLRTSRCVFLKENMCVIHEVKPLVCVAGPAGWHWIYVPQNFWKYARKCPGFDGGGANVSLHELDRLFVASWQAESEANKSASLRRLAESIRVDGDLLNTLERSEFVSTGKPDRRLVERDGTCTQNGGYQQ